MKISLNWLKRHIDFHEENLSLMEKAAIAAGMELENIQYINPILQVKVLSVTRMEKMRVKICTADLRFFNEQIIQVLCGADNVREGMFTLCAPIGTTIPNGLTIAERDIVGHKSYGMFLSADEMRKSDGSSGILECAEKEGIFCYDDIILTFKKPFNRWDLHCVRGVARMFAFAGLGTLKPLNMANKNDFKFDYSVTNNTNIPMTFSQVNNISVKSDVMQIMKNLGYTSELQALNDFIFLDIGHPIAIYDANLIGNSIEIGQATSKVYKTIKDDFLATGSEILISSNGSPISIGGMINIVGFSENTKNVVLEMGYFHSSNISSLISIAAYMFWLGICEEQMSMNYLHTLINGDISSILYISGEMQKSNTITISQMDLYELTEYTISLNEMQILLENQGYECSLVRTIIDVNDQVEMKVVCPSWRKDISTKFDLVEDIVRTIGYEKIIPISEVKALKISELRMDLVDQIKLKLSNEYNEIIGLPFTNMPSDTRIMNAMNSQECYMRGTLYATLRKFIDNKQWSNRIFTYGKIYGSEEYKLGILLKGCSDREFGNMSKEYDFFDLKRVLYNLPVKLTPISGELPEFLDCGCTYKEGYIGRVKSIKNCYFAEISIIPIKNEFSNKKTITYTDVSMKFSKDVIWSMISEKLPQDHYVFDVFYHGEYVNYGITFIDEAPLDLLISLGGERL